jgi:hypothetical protein
LLLRIPFRSRFITACGDRQPLAVLRMTNKWGRTVDWQAPAAPSRQANGQSGNFEIEIDADLFDFFVGDILKSRPRYGILLSTELRLLSNGCGILVGALGSTNIGKKATVMTARILKPQANSNNLSRVHRSS